MKAILTGMALLTLAAPLVAQQRDIGRELDQMEEYKRALERNRKLREDQTPEEKAAEKSASDRLTEGLRMQKLPPVARPWVGIWSLTNERGGLVGRIELKSDLTAVKPGVGATAKDLKLVSGKWKLQGGLRISWDDGAVQTIKATKNKKLSVTTLMANAKPDEPPPALFAAKEAAGTPLLEPVAETSRKK